MMSIITCRYGDFSVPESSDLILNAMRQYGEWGQQEVDLLSQLIHPGDIVIDAGAFIGTHARAFSMMVGPDGAVHAFEPNPASQSLLLENANLSRFANITTYQTALGEISSSGIILPTQNNEENLGGTNVAKNSPSFSGIEVTIRPLDDYDFGEVDFIKADLEGMEYSMLLGAKKIISRDRPIIFLEANSLQASYPIISWAHAMDYSVLGVLSDAFNPSNFNGISENMFGNAKECGLLLIHNEKLAEIENMLSGLNTLPIESVDSLALLFLLKPQFYEEVLDKTLIADIKRTADQTFSSYAAITYAAVTERDGQIASLSQAVTERDGQIVSLQQEVFQFASSRSWRITRPLRWLARLRRGEFDTALDPLRRVIANRRTSSPSTEVAENQSFESQLAPVPPTHPVAVIVPAYRGVEITQRCIESAMPGVLAVADARLLAINDNSPDEGMVDMLAFLQARWPDHLEVLQNDANLGFVQTVNRGITVLAGHDVVLLNSDVIVPSDWLARLRIEAYSRPNAGTVTPFSNNATICSFPFFLQENAAPYGLEVEQVDSVFRKFPLPCIEAPTGVGFCMYVRRACLNDVGVLDAKRFGRGYGEENDLCQRALKSGWVNLITPNLYAFHEGGVSFSTEKQALIERALRVIWELHPKYHAEVADFIRLDPLRKARMMRHLQLLATLSRPKVLYISPRLAGGVRQHLEELTTHMSNSVGVLLLMPDGADGFALRMGQGTHADILRFGATDYPWLVALLRASGVSCVHVHHTMGLPQEVLNLPQALGAKWLVTVHDYYWLNGNPTLTNETGIYHGYSDDLKHTDFPLPDGISPSMWRDRLRPLIEGATCVIFPSAAVRTMFEGHYRFKRTVVASHLEPGRDVHAKLQPWRHASKRVIGVLGALGKEKGADFLEELASLAMRQEKPCDFRLLGYAYRPLRGVLATGAYRQEDLAGIINMQDCSLIFFPARCPETYSYTLSYALDSGLPIIAPDIGAFPERLSGRDQTWVYPLDMTASELLTGLDSFFAALDAGKTVTAPVWSGEVTQEGFYEGDYQLIVADGVRTIPSTEARLPEGCPARIWRSPPLSRTLREDTLHLLWRCYMNPWLHWLGRLVPLSVLRAIRRGISTSPMQDVLHGNNSKR